MAYVQIPVGNRAYYCKSRIVSRRKGTYQRTVKLPHFEQPGLFPLWFGCDGNLNVIALFKFYIITVFVN